jgi:phage/plasmid-associated DNA primase
VPAPVKQDIEPEPVLLAAQPKTDVELYHDERVGRDEGASITALALYDDYCQWCEAKGKQPLGLPIFTRKFSDLGVQKAKVAGRIRYLGVRLLFADEDEGLRELSAVS